jgi:cephalosporin hydroxylase
MSMRLLIDTEKKNLQCWKNSKKANHNLYSKKAFELISDIWLAVGWNEKYPYTFTWMGRPIIQLPEDMIRTQEVIFQVKPDVIIETGIAHGGSLIFNASLCKLMGKGRVIGVDIDIREHNRKAIEAHPLFPMLTLIQGSSIDPAIVSKVKSLVSAGETVLVLLDSCHTRAHVNAELAAYHTLVTEGSYIVATDGSMKDLSDVPRGKKEWTTDNPCSAAKDFVKKHKNFKIETPPWLFNESRLSKSITHWPGAWIKRIK